MSDLIFSSKTQDLITVDMSPLIPDNLQNKNLAELKKIKLKCGNKQLKLDSLFEISGSSTSDSIIINRCQAKLDYIGHAMTRGSIKVNGNVGDYLGKDMAGGKIYVSGNAGLWAGTGMKNAHIEIKHDVGDYLGATMPGNQYGMKSGSIHVHGNAADRVGECMRRGIIAIAGNTGDYCGCQMRAGTILVLGNSGNYTGYGMRRGSIILANKPAKMLPTFNSSGRFELGFIKLIFKHLSLASSKFNILRKSPVLAERIVGDLAVSGKGELLILR